LHVIATSVTARELTCHGITQCYLPPERGDIPAFTPAWPVLDLATPDGCKAELTFVRTYNTYGTYTTVPFYMHVNMK